MAKKRGKTIKKYFRKKYGKKNGKTIKKYFRKNY